jgi:hypothetical protein
MSLDRTALLPSLAVQGLSRPGWLPLPGRRESLTFSRRPTPRKAPRFFEYIRTGARNVMDDSAMTAWIH